MSFDIKNPNPNNLDVTMTVALPAWNSGKIIWLALEGLRLQRDVDFGWELIIWEEFGESAEIVKEFAPKLPNCLRVRYKSLPKKITLVAKWLGIRDEASTTSSIYVLHAADCFSPDRRLYIHNKHFDKHKDCILSTQGRGLFYNIITEEKILYKCLEKRFNLNMAYRMSAMKKVKPNDKLERGTDSYIWKCTGGKPTNVKFFGSIDGDNWMTGMDTDGYNNISLTRKRYYKIIKSPFYPYDEKNCFKHIPQHVKDFLISLKP